MKLNINQFKTMGNIDWSIWNLAQDTQSLESNQLYTKLIIKLKFSRKNAWWHSCPVWHTCPKFRYVYGILLLPECTVRYWESKGSKNRGPAQPTTTPGDHSYARSLGQRQTHRAFSAEQQRTTLWWMMLFMPRYLAQRHTRRECTGFGSERRT